MWLFPLVVLLITLCLSLPAGLYLAHVLDDRARLPAWLRRIEACFDTGPQTWKQYAADLLLFNVLLFAVSYIVLALQPVLPLNPDHKHMLAPSTIFHTVISFVTNNSQQHYAGEVHLSYFSQLTVIVGNMFFGGGVSLSPSSAWFAVCAAIPSWATSTSISGARLSMSWRRRACSSGFSSLPPARP